MSWFKKSCRRLKEKVFGSKKKEKIFTWDQARFEEMMNAESEEDSVESTMSPAQDTDERMQVQECRLPKKKGLPKIIKKNNEGTAQPTSLLIQHIEGSATIPVKVLAWILVNQHTDLDADYPQSTVKKTKGGSAGDKVSSEGRGPNQNNPSSLDALRLHYRRENEEMWINWKRAISKINV